MRHHEQAIVDCSWCYVGCVIILSKNAPSFREDEGSEVQLFWLTWTDVYTASVDFLLLQVLLNQRPRNLDDMLPRFVTNNVEALQRCLNIAGKNS